MRSTLYSLIAAGFFMFMAGCGGATPVAAPQANANANPVTTTARPATPELAGSWQGNMVVNPAAAEKLTPEQVASLAQMKMEMVFHADGKLELHGQTGGKPYSSENRWKVLSAAPGKLTIESTDADGRAKPVDLLFEGRDVFRMPLQTEVADLGSMRFERLR